MMNLAGQKLNLDPKEFPARSRVAGQKAAENPGLVERITRNILPQAKTATRE